MKSVDNNELKVGVIVGRFQVAELTEGHKEIFDYVLSKNHNQNIVILGVAPTKATKNNPLDYDSRRRMINDTYPGKFIVMYIKDEQSDEEWSKKLDKMIIDVANDREVVLYGSRDSFVAHYTGKLPTEEYKQQITCSGTEQRYYAGKRVQNSAEWRAGAMWATQNQYDSVYPTVDCVIFDDYDFQYVFMAKKEGESLLRFVGGFADPKKDNSYEDTARREAAEETGLECQLISWIGSAKIDDWRYRSESDKIITNLFAMKRIFGAATAKDDIKELHRVELSKLTDSMVQPEHRVLLNMVKLWVQQQTKEDQHKWIVG